MLLSQLGRLHQTEVVRFLEWMRSEDIGAGAEAYEVVEEQDEVS